MLFKLFLFLSLLLPPTLASSENSEVITIGSKRFTENYIIAEIFAQLLESENFIVKRQMGLGGTMVAYNALKTNEIDIYPDYTGTIAESITKTKEHNIETINRVLSKDQVTMLTPLGFDNTYCLIMKQDIARTLGIKTISDLNKHPSLIGAISFEFQARSDGWKNLKKVYSLTNNIRGIDIPLTYEALHKDKVDFAEAYSTEPLIQKMNFIVLEDDKNFFPKYEAIPLAHKNISEQAKSILNRLEGKINNDVIMKLNNLAVNKVPIKKIANDYLIETKLIHSKNKKEYKSGISWPQLFERTKTHLFLTGFAVLLATLVAVPLASFFSSNKKVSQFLLSFTGILQTIPSIALLTFMIPLFGIGFKPAIVGLFIYSLLPILRNTHTAMTSIDPRIIIAAKGIGLYPSEIFWSVKFPLAFPTILAGIRTATTLNIGTATLAAFIGAGGLGEPIVTGLALNDSALVLQGAIPAAALAILIDSCFGLADRLFTKNI